MMRTILLLIVLAIPLPAAADGDGDGRTGNRHFKAGRYEEAATAYRRGLESATREGETSAHAFALMNNLGAALYRLGRFEEAQSAYTQAGALASDSLVGARATYNAGNAAFKAEKLELATALYRQALLSDPSNRDAKINYEFVKRRLQSDQGGEQQQQQDPTQPTEYARWLKAQADSLVARRFYGDAHGLMMDGLQVDKSVGAYQSFIERLGGIVDIGGDE